MIKIGSHLITSVITIHLLSACGQQLMANSSDGQYSSQYSQKIDIVFKTKSAAEKASVTILPLYHNYDAAFSTRWDDNTTDNLNAHKVMVQYQQKGTFYFNDPTITYGSLKVDDTVNTLTKSLVKGGNAIGVHTLTHEFLPYLSKNRQYREILEDRINLEVNSQSPVLSFTYPFMSNKLDLDSNRSYDDIEEMLLRSGIYGVSEDKGSSRLITTTPVFIDGKPWWNNMTIEKAKSATPKGTERTLYLNTMHAWPSSWGGNDFTVLADVYKTWGGNPRWWYCNTNDYAAYRYQFTHSSINTTRHNKTLSITLTRPNIYVLNNGIPLTMKIDGAVKEDITTILCSTANIERDLSGIMFDCHHDTNVQMPVLIGKIENPDKSDKFQSSPAIKDIMAVLYKQENDLILRIKNTSAHPISNAHITFRLPLQYKQGVIEKHIDYIPVGKETKISVVLKVYSNDFLYTCDKTFYAAQIDFYTDKQIRVYTTYIAGGVDKDTHYSRDGFLVLGPIPVDRSDFNSDQFIDNLYKANKIEPSYHLFESVDVKWAAIKPDKSSIFDPNLIYITGKPRSLSIYRNDPELYYPHGHKLVYVLWGTVKSAADATVKAVYAHENFARFSVNGVEIKGDQVTLKKGDNDIKIVYSPLLDENAFSPYYYGAYFKLTDGNGEMIRDLEFVRPNYPGE